MSEQRIEIKVFKAAEQSAELADDSLNRAGTAAFYIQRKQRIVERATEQCPAVREHKADTFIGRGGNLYAGFLSPVLKGLQNNAAVIRHIVNAGYLQAVLLCFGRIAQLCNQVAETASLPTSLGCGNDQLYRQICPVIKIIVFQQGTVAACLDSQRTDCTLAVQSAAFIDDILVAALEAVVDKTKLLGQELSQLITGD